MSRAEEFVNAVKGDPDLEAQLSAAATSEEARKIVTAAGFPDVSSSDVQAVLAAENDNDELSEHQLAAASGAGGFAMSPSWLHSDPGWDRVGDMGGYY
ncbi:MAG TPA: Nif11-like leader peptide family natural product precursor [Propionibacteriaceae bacterium]|jgi:predicted ribosomally synthesized peptide with nif11-like leader